MPSPEATILAKTPLPMPWGSDEIRERYAAQIRERAFFSARTIQMDYVRRLQEVCAEYAAGIESFIFSRYCICKRHVRIRITVAYITVPLIARNAAHVHLCRALTFKIERNCPAVCNPREIGGTCRSSAKIDLRAVCCKSRSARVAVCEIDIGFAAAIYNVRVISSPQHLSYLI